MFLRVKVSACRGVELSLNAGKGQEKSRLKDGGERADSVWGQLILRSYLEFK